MGDIITSLASVGLRIEFLHEFPGSVNFLMFAHMEKGADGRFRLPGQKIDVPLMYSIRATKDM